MVILMMRTFYVLGGVQWGCWEMLILRDWEVRCEVRTRNSMAATSAYRSCKESAAIAHCTSPSSAPGGSRNKICGKCWATCVRYKNLIKTRSQLEAQNIPSPCT